MTEMHEVWFRAVTIYKNNIWSVGLYEAYEDNGAVGQVLCHDITQIIQV